MVLDEPNSNLDQKGEIALLQALREAKANKITTAVTTHRMQLLSEVDKILIMQDGLVAAYGPREEILKQFMRNQQTTQQQPAQEKNTQEKNANQETIGYSASITTKSDHKHWE